MTSNPQYQQFVGRSGLHDTPPRLTPEDILGPFYRPGAPFRNCLCDYPDLQLDGTVTFPDGSPVGSNAYIEFWQADKNGKYDEHGPRFRGIQPVRPDGSYHLETTRPGDYDISDPGAPQPHEFRCSHIHVKVWIDGKDVLTTQLYFPDDQYNKTDHWFDPRRVIKFSDQSQAHGRFDFVVAKP